MLSLEMICQAQYRTRGLIHRTPLAPSTALSDYLGARVSLKLELLQKTGSFKPRGAFNKLLSLSPEERGRGVVAVSGGNHAQGVAFAAKRLGIPAVYLLKTLILVFAALLGVQAVALTLQSALLLAGVTASRGRVDGEAPGGGRAA